jgi:hypothetical protein
LVFRHLFCAKIKITGALLCATLASAQWHHIRCKSRFSVRADLVKTHHQKRAKVLSFFHCRAGCCSSTPGHTVVPWEKCHTERQVLGISAPG